MHRSQLLSVQSLAENQALHSNHHPAKPKTLVAVRLSFQFQADQKVTLAKVNHPAHHHHHQLYNKCTHQVARKVQRATATSQKRWFNPPQPQLFRSLLRQVNLKATFITQNRWSNQPQLQLLQSIHHQVVQIATTTLKRSTKNLTILEIEIAED